MLAPGSLFYTPLGRLFLTFPTLLTLFPLWKSYTLAISTGRSRPTQEGFTLRLVVEVSYDSPSLPTVLHSSFFPGARTVPSLPFQKLRQYGDWLSLVFSLAGRFPFFSRLEEVPQTWGGVQDV